MKKFNLKKIVMMGLAAVMSVSTTGVSSFAAKESDPLIASITNDSKAVIEVHESDLVDGKYSVVYEGVTIIIGENADNGQTSKTDSNSTRSVTTGMFIGYVNSTPLRSVSETNSYSYTFDIAKGYSKFTPYYHTVASGCNSLTYAITGDASYGSKVIATAYLDANGGSHSEVNLYTGTHYLTFNGLNHGDKTYAKVYNKSYSSNATGVCNITT